MIDTFLFDLDGTLINSPEIIMEGYVEALRVHNPNHIITEDEKTEILGFTLIKAFERHAKNEEHYNSLVDTFKTYTNELSLKMLNAYENAKSVIQYLRSKGYCVGIVTSKSFETVHENLSHVGLEDLFDVIVTSNDTVLHKPNPEPLLYALEKLNKPAKNAIYIGDHENDIKAGKNAYMKTGLVGFTYRLKEAMNEKPDYVFNNLNNIKEIF
ncbi:HAD family hydrolase [Haploplasma axanthum]|uniref:Pyrophosphatase ppaX n=1 Tax=Haploplasma axanthum TaxID=29552 RepID=A0A449BB73_HAPAX|nr:HAD family hydrolase [Haploplasma axanthum]VEU79575.1 Pyrophosphatase ppaX [Haploplasma axanthum]